MRRPHAFGYDRCGEHVYNYFRDYDPQIGRYVEPDPLGLRGGLNLYGYANQSPITFTDPTGEIPFLDLPCHALRLKVILLCKETKRRCEYGDPCEELRRKVYAHLACALAQSQLTKKCYPNDPTHGQRITDALNGAERCLDIWKRKQCNPCQP